MTQRFKVFALVLITLLSITLVNAQALIAGKVYDSQFNNVVADATVEITCRETTLTTKTLSDGTYAVRFENTQCSTGNTALVYAKKGGMIGGSEGKISECGTNCDDDYFSIINLKISNPNTSSSGGSSRRANNVEPILWFICGNDVCDTGESFDTCPKDCEQPPLIKEEEQKETLKINQAIEHQPINNGLAGVFLAITKYLTLTTLPIILTAILAFLIILLIGHKIIQRKR